MVIKNGLSAWRDDEIDINKEIKAGAEIDRTSFYSFYLEYDKDGRKFQGNTQLDIIRRAIAASKKPVYLVVYANSWQNNANTGVDPSSDAISFPYLLARRSFENPDMNVIGVFVGWSGKKYKDIIPIGLTVRDRADVADAIGKKGEVRSDIISLVSNVNKNNPSGYSLIMGKSFGARLLSQAFMEDLVQIKQVKDWPLGDNSLLVTLNSAIGANAFDEFYKKMLDTDSKTNITLQRPLWLNLTSKDDKATRWLYPSARFIGQNLSKRAGSKNHKTIGHYDKYLSYEVTVTNYLDENVDCNFINAEDILNNNTAWFKIPEKPYKCATRHLYKNTKYMKPYSQYYTTILRPLDESPNRDKFLGYMWNFRADESVIEQDEIEAKKNKSYGKHNAYVQTTLGRMLDDMLFTPPESLTTSESTYN